jgi:Glycerol kinase
MSYIVAIDQGTTSTRCIAFDQAGNIAAVAQEEITQYFPKPGWVEHNPVEIWESVRSTLLKVAKKVGPKNIHAIGITNQRETTVVWDKRTGKPVYNAIVWQSRQTVDICESLKAKGLDPEIRYKTGLLIDAYFSGTKIKWILENVAGARAEAEAGHLLFGTIDTWLLWHLSEGHVHATDFTNASRTMLYNIRELRWDSEILEAFGVPEQMLPEVRDSSHVYGYTGSSFGEMAGLPVAGIAGDQQAALFGQGCFEPGMAKNTYGTGCFMLMNTGKEVVASPNGLLTTIAWGLNGQVEYALEGSIFVAGSAVKWNERYRGAVFRCLRHRTARHELGFGRRGFILSPAFVGLGTPYWDSEVEGGDFRSRRAAPRAATSSGPPSKAWPTRQKTCCP